MVEAPPPTVEMIVRPTALVVVMTSPAVREMEFAVVLGMIDGADEVLAWADVARVVEGEGTALVVAATVGVLLGVFVTGTLVDGSVVEPGVGVEDS